MSLSIDVDWAAAVERATEGQIKVCDWIGR